MKAIANTTIRLGLINLPVQLVQAAEPANDVTFKQAGPAGETLRQAYLLPDGKECSKDDMQKGVIQGDQFYPIPKESIAQISEATKLPDLNIMEVLSRSTFEAQKHRATDLYFVQSTKKGGNVNAFKLFVDALEAEGKVMVTKFTPRSRQKLLVLFPQDGLLMAQGLAFEGDMRKPDENVEAHLSASYTEQEMTMAKQLIGALADNSQDSLTMEVDDAVPLRHKLVDDALNGRAIDMPTATPTQATTGLLADALAASLEAVKAA